MQGPRALERASAAYFLIRVRGHLPTQTSPSQSNRASPISRACFGTVAGQPDRHSENMQAETPSMRFTTRTLFDTSKFSSVGKQSKSHVSDAEIHGGNRAGKLLY